MVCSSSKSMMSDTILLADIEAMVREIAGEAAYVKAYEHLNRQRVDTQVARVELGGVDTFPRTVIVKHVPPDLYEHIDALELRSEFLEEMFNYVFLSEIRPMFEWFPRLLGGRRGLLMIEDLGPDLHEFNSDAKTIDSLAETFAKLHCATAGRYPLYMQLRRIYELDQADFREFSRSSMQQFVVLAAQQLKKYCQAMKINVDAYDNLIADVRATIDQPGEFLAFIHDDLVDRRQSVTIEGTLHLIDFEHAKYSHALLDISKPIIGKIEYNYRDDIHVLTHPNLPTTFTDIYRTKLEACRGASFDNQVWQNAVSSALIYSALSAIGILIQMPTELRLANTMPEYLRSYLARLLFLLQENDTHDELKDIFAQIVERVFTP